jgi:DNA polymerase I
VVWKYITDYESLEETIPEIMKHEVISLDVETRGLDVFTDPLLLVQIGTPNEVFIYDARVLNLQELFDKLQFYKGITCLHNAKFDCKYLRKYYNYLPYKIFDTMIAESLATAGVGQLYSSLNYLSTTYLNRPLVKEIRESFADATAFFSDDQLNYAADDAISTLQLYPILNQQLSDLGLQDVADLEFEIVKVVTDMELSGVNFSREIWQECYNKTLEDLIIAESQFKESVLKIGFLVVPAKKNGVEYMKEIPSNEINFNSPIQVRALLNRFGLKVPDTSVETLSEINHPLVQQLVTYRKLTKRAGTYGLNFFEYINPITGRIHAQFNQIGTETGRFSSDSPNLQNIPNPAKDKNAPNYRAAFIATPGYVMVIADYSQIELRILAEVSKEPKFIKAYADGADLHTLTATLMYHIDAGAVQPEQRSLAKNTNFAMAYGSGASNLAHKFRIPMREAEVLVENFHKGYPVLSSFLTRSGQDAVINHYSKTLLGRRRNFQIPSITNPDFKRVISSIKRQGTNHIVQGTSADMTKMAKVALYNTVGQLNGRLLLTVHDEIVAEFPEKFKEEGCKLVEQSMIEAGQKLISSVPVLVEVHANSFWSK